MPVEFTLVGGPYDGATRSAPELNDVYVCPADENRVVIYRQESEGTTTYVYFTTLRVLDPGEYVVHEIDEAETVRFEAFLDRNYSGWRDREAFKAKNAGTIQRGWRIGHDGVERSAFYRKQYVEISDEYYYDNDDEGDVDMTTEESLAHRICDIDGDSTPVAIWGRRK